MTAPLVLSLFPGIGLLDMAFEEEGFCVVRGPDLLWGGDVRRFHPPSGKFDGIIGGPPCQAFSRLRYLVEHNGYQTAPNLIPEYERCVAESAPLWFLMENVPDAPEPVVPGYTVRAHLIRDAWVGGETTRLRRFSFGSNHFAAGVFHIETLALHRPDPEPSALAAGSARAVPVAVGGSGKLKRTAAANLGYQNRSTLEASIRAQGLPEGFLDDAPFTIAGKCQVVGNGVPLPMGRAVARAVKRAMYPEMSEGAA